MRVLIVDDHEVVRRGVRSLLLGRYDVCGEAVDGHDALEQALALRPDIIVMDVSMPNLNGLEATRQLRALLPNCEILILSQHESSEMARQAFNAGARGYLVKGSISNDLLSALATISRHEPYFQPDIMDAASPSGLDVLEILQRSAAFERALRESEQLYRSTFELAGVGVAHISPEGRWLRVNPKLCEITGYSESELLQLTFQDLAHPEDLAADIAQGEQIRAGVLDKYSAERRCVRKDGSHIWVNLTVSGVRDSAGKLKHFISVMEDISERRDAEAARSWLAAIVQSSDDAIVSKDLNGIITSWNSAAARIFEFTAQEAVGKSITIIIPQELRDEETHILRRLRAGERIEHYETVRSTKSGKKLNVSLTISPVRDSKGRITGASKIARDITERKQVEKELREGQSQLALALESSRTGMFDWDVIDKTGTWNEQMAAIYAFNPRAERITADEWKGLFHPDDVRRLADEAAHALAEKEQFHFEYRTVRPDGETRWIFSHGRIMRDAHGKPVRLIGTHTDITDRKRIEQALQQRQAELNEAQRLAKIGSWQWLPKSDTMIWSEELYRIAGRDLKSPAVSYGEHATLYTPESWARLQAAVDEALRNQTTFSLELELIRADGTKRWVVANGEARVDSQGSGTALRGTVQDVTDRKRIEQELRQNEERTRFSLEAANVGTWDWDVHTGRVNWSSNMESVHGQSPGSFGASFDSFLQGVFAEDRPKVMQQIDLALSGAGKYHVEYRQHRADGTFGWMEATGQVVFDAARQPLRMFGICANITQRKQAEERERQITNEAVAATAKFRAVFEQTTVFAGIMTAEGILIDANRLSLDACGYRPDEVLGRPFWQTSWWRNFPESQDKIRAAIPLAAQGVPFREMLHYSWADGSERLVDFALFPIVDEAGQILFLHPTGVDITDLKRAEENYRKLVETLDAEVRARTRELEDRNADVLRQSQQVRDLSLLLLQTQDAERRHIARELHDSAGQTLAVLGMSLDQLVFKTEPVDPRLAQEGRKIQDLVRQLQREIRTTSYLLHPPLLDETGISSALRWYVDGLVERSGLAVDLALADDFGRLPAEMELAIFRLIQECLTNIHRHSGSKTASVRVLREDGNVFVEVRDQGKGIAPDRLAEVQSHGSGVGIRGIRERLRQFHGDLKIESNSSGTCISASIPIPKEPSVADVEPLQATA